MSYKPILICAIVILFIQCAKEFSCEDCLGWPIVPPTDSTDTPDTTRTTPNDLITSCSIFINDEKEVRYIYPEVTHKLHPGTWWIYDSIIMDGSKQYDRTYDLKPYLEKKYGLDKFKINDTFFVRYEIRYKYKEVEQVDLDTLIY